ncbi:Extracellular peptidase inhibitor [Fukomys damarensis]|uniref:Extracellular peptidase inhibitor n=1 Tax=Fukomys damarensis TaxID=885580 RepID=A0A091CW37_FUKDA|nr:Extracellular peptidase inhibitor [Fukomys damarensis]
MKISTVLVLVAFVAMGMDIAYARLPVHKKQQKPGDCPEVPRGQFGICAEACSGDQSCPGEQKCCRNGCGHVCKSPVFKVSINLSRVVQRAGDLAQWCRHLPHKGKVPSSIPSTKKS